MTELEFMGEARFGAGNGEPLHPEIFVAALVQFLDSHGYHDMARATAFLSDYLYRGGIEQ